MMISTEVPTTRSEETSHLYCVLYCVTLRAARLGKLGIGFQVLTDRINKRQREAEDSDVFVGFWKHSVERRGAKKP